MKQIVRLQDVKIVAYHGVHEEEEQLGNLYIVNVEVEEDRQTPISDDLEDTVDYSVLYDVVVTEMKIRSKLLENVAFRIQSSIKLKYPHIKKGIVRLAKQAPPFGGNCLASEIELHF